MSHIQKAVQCHPEVQVVAVDCPSGIDCDSGEVAPQCMRAQVTLTMAAAKQGLLREPASSFKGQITLVDIGIVTLTSTLLKNADPVG